MANDFKTPQMLVRDAQLMLEDELVLPFLTNRETEKKFAPGVGKTIKFTVPQALSGAEFFTTTSSEDIVETEIDLTIERHFYQKVVLSSDQLTYDIDKFNEQVQMPAIQGLVKKIEPYFMNKIAGGFARYISGTAGTNAVTQDDIDAAEQVIYDNKGDSDNVAPINSNTFRNFKKLDVFTNNLYGSNRPMSLERNTLPRIANIDLFRNRFAVDFDNYDFDDASTTATGTAGATTVTLASLAKTGSTANPGRIPEGARFVITGNAQEFVVTKEASWKTGTSVAVEIYPALPAGFSPSTADVTLSTPIKMTPVYAPRAVAGVVLPPVTNGITSAAEVHNGIGIRVIRGLTDTSTLSDTIVYDVYCACKVIVPEYGVIMQGNA